MNGTTAAEAGRKIKSALRRAYPVTKFTTKSRHGICITWSDDGPSEEQVTQSLLLSKHVTDVGRTWNGQTILRAAGDANVWFDRHNVAERAARAFPG